MTRKKTGPPEQSGDDLYRGLIQFHSSEAKALLDRYKHVENLIGKGHHAASDGGFCEDLVRQFFRSMLPARYSVDHGFVRHTPGYARAVGRFVSPQLDLIIHDAHNYSPIFRSGEFVIVLPKAVAAVVEVKKTLDSGELDKALANLATTKEVFLASGCASQKLFLGVFAFTASSALQSKAGRVSRSYENRLMKITEGHPPLNRIPDAIVVANEHVIYRHVKDQKQLTIYRTPAEHAGENSAVQLLAALLFQ